jgi:drug/metabolite transporter (DMT)-like permease
MLSLTVFQSRGERRPGGAMTDLVLYLTTVLIWGSTWLVINFQLGVYRYVIAAALLFVWCLLRGVRLRFGAAAHLRFMALGLLLFSLNYIATYSAQAYIASALNAVVFSSLMWLNVINTRIFFGTRIEPRMWIGAAIGMAGLGVLFWPDIAEVSLSDRTLLGAGLSLGGAFVASLGNMVSHRAQREGLPIVASNAWGMFYGALFTALIAWRRGLPFDFEYSAAYVLSLLYLAVFGSIVAFGSYLKLLGRIGPARAGYAMVMFPVVAVALSVLFEGLAIEWHVVTGLALVLGGNLAILGLRRVLAQLRAWSRRREPAAPGREPVARTREHAAQERSPARLGGPAGRQSPLPSARAQQPQPQ